MRFEIIERKCLDTGDWSADLCEVDDNDKSKRLDRVTANSYPELLKKKSKFIDILNNCKHE